MQITRLTAPAFPALTNAEIESWLRIDPDQDAANIAMLLASATEYVEGVTGLCLGQSTYRVEFDGLSDCYRLPLAPVQSITSVQTRDDTGALVTLTGWVLTSGILCLTECPDSPPLVTVVAGYADKASIPLQLAHAIAVLVSAGYNEREELSDPTLKTVERLCQSRKRFAW